MRITNTLYLLLLAYIISALVFWGFSLNKLSENIYRLDQQQVKLMVDSAGKPAEYRTWMSDLKKRKESRTKQYLGEGITFLAVILVGAGIVSGSIRRNLRLSRQQANFMLAVTHELKSPLAAIKLNLQTMQKRTLSEEQINMLLARSVKETERLDVMCNNMLVASQIEGRHHKLARERLNLSVLLQEALDTYVLRHPDRFGGEHPVEAEVWVKGDKLMLQMAITNLLSNAVKYSPAGAPVRVSLAQEYGRAILCVADRGPGIPDDEKNKIFSRFYRIGDESTRSTKGTGLGLYLARKIIRGHKGRLTVSDQRGGGSVFMITLPVRNA
jgi:signal transduction histidine kinase